MIEGMSELVKKLKGLARRPGARRRSTARVQYQTPYCVQVHEDLAAPRPNGGQAKYLEQPLRESEGEIRAMVADLVKSGVPFDQAVVRAAEWFLEERSKPLVPVRTGALKASGRVVSERTGG